MTTNPTPPTVGRPLTEAERTMLRYALDQAQEQMLCVGDEFSEDDHDAIDSLRRLADEAQQQPAHSCGNCEGIDPASCLTNPDRARDETALKRAHVALAEQAGRYQAALARVHEWVTSDVVTARSEFGNGYREAQRDIRDLLDGRRLADEAQQQEPEPSVHGESVAHLAGLHDGRDAWADDEQRQGATCTNCRGSGLDPRCNGEFDCPDCTTAVDARQDGEA